MEPSQNQSKVDESMGIIVEKNPSKSRLAELGITSWPKWACAAGKYKLRYDAEETCYLVKGKVRAYPKRKGGQSTESTTSYVEFGAGDLVTFPQGLSCTWDVSLAVDKFYTFHPSSSSPPHP
ncbi:uncharacterized protein LOC130812919 [Amaranthus tricolor]|uniref:uncharacterized protein LOC130812919 n=1 Tax=Amaranthus tricolor TaxID=29722 RepID=UPI002584A404|nr:uncharacterized protein LOC130812919 [Amaranthus tricolor]